jgi:hypothetical protein
VATAQTVRDPLTRYLTVWDGPLPRNPGGKILKAHLRQQVEWGEPLR